MPTPHRSGRSLLALALVANLVVAAVPGAALGGQSASTRDVVRTGAGIGPGPDVQDASLRASTPASVGAYDRGPALRGGLLRPAPAAVVAPEAAEPTPWISRPVTDAPVPRARSMSPAQAAGGADPASFRGRNHVWIPALGVNRSVSFFSCSSSAYPGDRVYRWGCAGGNNVYLFGHAHSVFKPLHDAYVRGRLAKGMKVYYADGNGKVRTYAVSWWKVTTPDKGAWAYAGQSRPSLTLQTCVGSRSQYRLIVRLLQVG